MMETGKERGRVCCYMGKGDDGGAVFCRVRCWLNMNMTRPRDEGDRALYLSKLERHSTDHYCQKKRQKSWDSIGGRACFGFPLLIDRAAQTKPTHRM